MVPATEVRIGALGGCWRHTYVRGEARLPRGGDDLNRVRVRWGDVGRKDVSDGEEAYVQMCRCENHGLFLAAGVNGRNEGKGPGQARTRSYRPCQGVCILLLFKK